MALKFLERSFDHDDKKVRGLKHHVTNYQNLLNEMPDISDRAIQREIKKDGLYSFFGLYPTSREQQGYVLQARFQLAKAIRDGNVEMVPDDSYYMGGVIKIENTDGICDACVHRRTTPKIILKKLNPRITLSRCSISETDF